VVGGSGNGAVEGVDEGGVEGTERELGDYVGEVECWWVIVSVMSLEESTVVVFGYRPV
jgi:hypothetical protein